MSEQSPSYAGEHHEISQRIGHVGQERAGVSIGAVHHVELWVPDLARAERSWGWLLGELGYAPFQRWEHGRSWRHGSGTYVVVEQSPAASATDHDRMRPGLNHLAFQAGDPARLDALVQEAAGHGWSLLFADRHPFAGGPDHHAAYLVDDLGYEVELVASDAAGS
jgi:catechol 2,3-dioxygenase-like lactoylglutathione lyase family enzyme